MKVNPFEANCNETSDDIKKLNLILMGHAAFQILNAGCELKIFEILNETPLVYKDQLNDLLNLKERPLNCILLGLVSLGLIEKKNDQYQNSQVIKKMFDCDFWKFFKDIVNFENKIVYLGQYDFVESLKSDSNIGLRRVDGHGETLYHRFEKNSELRSAFYNYMSSWSEMSIPLLLNADIIKSANKILDVGGGDATNAIEIAKINSAALITVLELKENGWIAKDKITKNNLQDRIKVIEGSMFTGEFGSDYDCIMFIHQLVIWSREQICFLLTKAHKALSPGGRVIIFNSITSDDENGPLFGALDSVYFMSIPASGGMIYSYKFYEDCLVETHYREIERICFKSWSPHGVIIATK